jgi:hypothetical protein
MGTGQAWPGVPLPPCVQMGNLPPTGGGGVGFRGHAGQATRPSPLRAYPLAGGHILGD